MAFNDLKKGDKLFVVNQGYSFGIRIEEHIIEEITEAYGGEYFAFKLDDTTTAYIYKDCINDDKCSFYFVNKNDAQEYFLKKYPDVYNGFIVKAAQYLKIYNECIGALDNMSKEQDNIETELILNGYNLEN